MALAFAIAYQVIQRFTYTGYGMSEYGRSLWYVTYEHGFVRRGLAGEALRTIVGGRPTIATVDLVQNIVAVATLGAMVALVVVLARRRTIVAYAAAGALVVAPFAFDSVGGQRRPDLLAFLLLAVVGLWAGTRAVAPTRVALVAGALLAVCTLASEVAPLIVGPWLVVVVIAATRARSGPAARTAVPVMLCTAPSVTVLCALTLHGPPSAQQVLDLELGAPNIIGGHGSVFEYLGDTFGSSFQRVIERSHPELSIVVGFALVALLVAVFRGPLPYVRSLGQWLLPRRGGARRVARRHGRAHDRAVRPRDSTGCDGSRSSRSPRCSRWPVSSRSTAARATRLQRATSGTAPYPSTSPCRDAGSSPPPPRPTCSCSRRCRTS